MSLSSYQFLYNTVLKFTDIFKKNIFLVEAHKITKHHRTCRAWVGVRLPFRNTYQKGIYPFLGQTRYYAPDEIGGLFRWADPLTTVTHSPSPLERSSRHPPLSLHIRTLSLPCFVVVSVFHIHSTLPRGFSLAPSHIARIDLMTLYLHYYKAWFPPTTTHEYPVLYLTPPFPFPFPCSTYSPATFPAHTITVFTTQYTPFPSQAHAPPHLLPLSPLPHQPPIPYINRNGIPIPVINNEFADLIPYFYSEYEGLSLSREVDSASYESQFGVQKSFRKPRDHNSDQGLQADPSPVNLGNEARTKRIIRINVSHSVAAMKLGRGAIK